MSKLNFSDRLMKCFGFNLSYNDILSLFQSEFIKIFNELKLKYNINFDINDISWINIKSKDKDSYPISRLLSYKDGSYEVEVNPERLKQAQIELTYEGKPVYKNVTQITKNAACHEACHLIADLVSPSDIDNHKHRGLFRSMYEPLRSRYTNVPIIEQNDGELINFNVVKLDSKVKKEIAQTFSWTLFPDVEERISKKFRDEI